MSLEFGLTITLLGIVSVFSALTLVAVACGILKRVFKEKAELAPPPSASPPAAAEAPPLNREKIPKVELPTVKSRDFKITIEGEEHRVRVEDAGILGEELEDITPGFKVEREVKVVVGGKEYKVKVEEVGAIPPIMEEEVRVKEAVEREEEKVIKAPMQGTIIRIPVKVGDKVEKGDVVVVLEAMKMENEIESSVSGVVKTIKVSEGDAVAAGDILVVVD
ncbi:MAG: OadG family transporter subunit [Candidatus Bathyarchaeia archaeon]